jgi:Flp pilus assembly protein TadD/DNA-binding response OmpR family regulator
MGSVSMRAPPPPPRDEQGSESPGGKPSWHPRQDISIKEQSQPAVLIVGAQEALLAPLTEALNRHGVFVETTGIADVMQAVIAGAPDLILLADAAAKDRGTDVIGRLATSPLSSVIPVAILDDDTGLEARLQAFRHGAAALVRRSASVDAIATDVARLVREIPERANLGLGDIGEVTLEELVHTLASELRSGILSVRAKGQEGEEAMRLVLGGGRPVSAIIDEFVQRMGTHVLSAEPLEYEFDERAGGTVQLFGRDSMLPEAPKQDVDGVRVLLADDDTGRADAVAQELRRHGATVVVTDFEPTEQRFARLKELDPMLLVIGEEQLNGDGFYLVQRLRGDIRLRWASLLVVNWGEIWPEQAGAPEIQPLLSGLYSLSEPERAIRSRVQQTPQVELRLETTGPARLIRALAMAEKSVRATIQHSRALVKVDLSNGLVVGAKADTIGGPESTVEGAAALSAVMVMSSGRVRVEHVDQPAATNLMSTPDVALSMANAEVPPIAPSLPAPPMGAESEGRGLLFGLPMWVIAGGAATAILGLVGAVVLALVVTVPRKQPEVAPAPVASGSPAVATSASAAPAAVTPSASAAPKAAVSPKPAIDPTRMCKEIVGQFVGGGIGAELKNASDAMMRGDLKAARRWYCVATDRYPEDTAALRGLVRLLMIDGEPNIALHYAEKLTELDPESASYRALVGDAHALLGNYDEARAAFCQAAAVDPTNADSVRVVERRYRAVAYRALDEKRFGEGVRFFRRAVTLNPDSIEAMVGLSRALLLNGEKLASLEWAKKAEKVAPGNVQVLVMLGDALARNGDRVGAVRAWKKALSIEPGSAEARFRMLQVQRDQ